MYDWLETDEEPVVVEEIPDIEDEIRLPVEEWIERMLK